ncbi:SET domain [Trinorchestia longiramus]|nr:SET domain [Trinorchestia longiramus]
MASANSLQVIENYFQRITETQNTKEANCFISSALKLSRNDSVGRYLETTRDVGEGEVLIKETPLIVTPSAGAGPTCVRCCKNLKAPEGRSSCSDCGAPVCKESCRRNYHSKEECTALKNLNQNPWKESRIPLINMALTPLRASIMLESDDTLRPVFMSLESFASKREKLPIGRLIDSKIVPLLRDIKQSNITRDFIHHSCGAFDTNAFKVRNMHEEEGRAVMPLSAMLMHECVPNSEHWFVDGYLVVRAAMPIPKGSVVSISYTSSMLGTQSRQKHLSFTKLFLCQCRRCKDPTELGTHISSVLCRSCKKGLLVPPNQSEQNSGSECCCIECSKKFSSEMINTVCRAGAFTMDVSEPEDLVDRIQDVQMMVGVQHYGTLQLLVTLFRVLIGKSLKSKILTILV